MIEKIKDGEELQEIKKFIEEEHAEPLYNKGEIVGCVKNAHDVDQNLSAHVLFENIVSKASCSFSIINMLDKYNINKDDIDYVIDCCEEACGDMNQRGGGNFAKAAAEEFYDMRAAFRPDLHMAFKEILRFERKQAAAAQMSKN